ncbi:similar to Saccharomyces cerevisiae YHR086W NAM8 RNA binding protein, component of the U1 snRNP protein [Maudiozyma barnettii]|uniref:Similar to Saccharomyces cerevisiae YHR086W NAM8 RNA binding protein, component of the U1 snRNP protein n=1 Tax=Maudiozyma barnettii TaxID=61262 RepID=A0A8H2VAU8_9SACH|nr:Nam8p [Kazachstania barnettii]CAB4251865.1 similar to Saccharomyces cerevisiae YHR086W NAM8 RNA binding protein, component of the U1 snRNP protein [Kazachstania barnettii]CAD1778151.1 similar to Saccharomyces cerevisiae YHR086W NAM8 RNA binding protein, component of the U1 snRNP protein [Kazachstania barnettii]
MKTIIQEILRAQLRGGTITEYSSVRSNVYRMSYHQYNNGHYQRNTGYNNNNNNNYQQRNNGYGYQNGYQDHNNRSNNYGQRDTYPSRERGATRTHHINDNIVRSTNQLYMGDLDLSWTEDTIKEIWKTLGEESIRVKMMMNNIMNNNNTRFSGGNTTTNSDNTKNQGYCFIEFSTNEQAANALLKNGMNIPIFPQRRLKLNWGSGGNSNNNNSNSNNNNYNNAKPTDESNMSSNDTNYSVFVGDLAPNVTESQLYELFNDKYPSMIERTRVMIDRVTGVSKGYGFVKFINAAIQSRAMIELQGAYLNGRAIKINSTGQRQQSQPQYSTDPKSIGNGNDNKYPNKNNKHHNKINKLSLFMLPVQQLPRMNHMTDPNNTTLYITKISPYVNELELEEYFKPFGSYYDKLRIFAPEEDDGDTNNNRPSSKSYYQQGIIQYVNRYDAERAMVALHQYAIDDIPLQLSWGLPVDDDKLKIKQQDIQLQAQPSYPNDIYSYV